MARRKNVKRIDPRYFLHETVNRNDDGSARDTSLDEKRIGSLFDRETYEHPDPEDPNWPWKPGDSVEGNRPHPYEAEPVMGSPQRDPGESRGQYEKRLRQGKHRAQYRLPDSGELDPHELAEEELEGAGPAGRGIHQNQSPVPGRPDPRFGRMTVTFDSEVDKALYIVYNAMKKSKREPDFLQWLSSLGYTQDEMMRNGETIKGELKRQVSEHPDFPGWSGWSSMTGELNIPMTAEEPIEVV